MPVYKHYRERKGEKDYSACRYENGRKRRVFTMRLVPEMKEKADAGDVDAMFYVGFSYLHLEHDRKTGYQYLTKAADAGNKDAIVEISLCSYPEAKSMFKLDEWVRTPAENGDGFFCCLLGSLYRRGELVDCSYEEAEKWYRKAISLGDKDGKYEIRSLYRYFDGVASSIQEAVELDRAAADKGD